MHTHMHTHTHTILADPNNPLYVGLTVVIIIIALVTTSALIIAGVYCSRYLDRRQQTRHRRHIPTVSSRNLLMRAEHEQNLPNIVIAWFEHFNIIMTNHTVVIYIRISLICVFYKPLSNYHYVKPHCCYRYILHLWLWSISNTCKTS